MKIHITPYKDVAQLIKADLEDKYKLPVKLTDPKEDTLFNKFKWDLGGALFADWQDLSVDLPDFRFAFWPHQLDELIFYLNKDIEAVENIGGLDLVRLKDELKCLVLPLHVAKLLLKTILENKDSFKKESEKYWAAWDRAVDSMRKSPHPNIDLSSIIKKNKYFN